MGLSHSDRLGCSAAGRIDARNGERRLKPALHDEPEGPPIQVGDCYSRDSARKPGARLGPTTRSLTLLSDALDRLAGSVIQEAFADRLSNARAVQTALREQLGRIPMINETIGESQL